MKISLRLLLILLVLGFNPFAQAKRAPNLEFKDLSGNTRKVAELRGSIAVVNFWATWCGPCREELPLLSKLSQGYGARKVRFIAASADGEKDRSKVDQFLKKSPLGMEVWVGADLDMLERAGLGEVLPATLILDDQGEIIARIQGQAREADIRVALDWLLGGRVGPAPPSVIRHY
jgi:thiol-disulfide isomerase/thioredoxin